MLVRPVHLALAITALVFGATLGHAQERSALQRMSRGAASVVAVVTRDAGGQELAAAVGVFTDVGRLVVPRGLLLDAAGTPAVVSGGRDRRITAVLADDPRAGLVLLAVDLPDGAPPAIRTRASRTGLVAGAYRALADDGTDVAVEVGAEQNIVGIGPVCRVATAGAMPRNGSPVVDDGGEMVGILLERSAGTARLTVLVPSARALSLPAVPPSAVGAWQRAAQSARPAEAEAAFLRGLDASLQGRAADAADGFREAAARDEADGDARAALAASELAAGRRDEALAAYRQAIAAAPDNPRFHHELAVVLSDASRWDEAAREFGEVARLRPGDAEAHFNVGTVYGQLGRLEDEYQAYQAALRQNPAHVNALRNLGVTCITQKRYAEAVTVTIRALRFRPSDARLRAQLGVAYFHLKDYRAAIEELRQAIALDQDFVQAHYGLAVAYAASGQRDAALKECEHIKRLDPARGAEVARLLR